VEVVQDLLDHVTYAGGVGRRRVDAVRGLGSGTPAPGEADCAVIAEDPANPKGPRIIHMKELMFHEVLDKPFDEKEYRMQLEEFAYRGERIIKQVDHKLGEVETMVVHDVLARSRQLPHFLRNTNDELRRGHQLIRIELEEVWHMKFEPFFYPSEDDSEAAAVVPGGWLDLDDMFLTARLLTRYVAELVGLIGAAVSQLPDEALDRHSLEIGPPDPALLTLVQAFAARVPWIGASLPSDTDIQPGSSVAASNVAQARQRASTLAAAERAGDTAMQDNPLGSAADSTASSPNKGGDSPQGLPVAGRQSTPIPSTHSPLDDAITALDNVLTVHLKHLVSDLHRTMYQTFVRMCTCYVRWKRAFAAERERATQAEAAKISGQTRRQSFSRTSSAALMNFGGFSDRKKSVDHKLKGMSRRKSQISQSISFAPGSISDVPSSPSGFSTPSGMRLSSGRAVQARPSIVQEALEMDEMD